MSLGTPLSRSLSKHAHAKTMTSLTSSMARKLRSLPRARTGHFGLEPNASESHHHVPSCLKPVPLEELGAKRYGSGCRYIHTF